MKKLYLILTLVFFGGASSLQAGIFNPKTFITKNGITVVVLENHRAPVVTQLVWYKAGAIDDLSGKTGTAHFLEHLMFKGPGGSASERLSREVSQIGGKNNAGTTWDLTFYYETVAAEHLEKIMKLEAGRMEQLRVLGPEARKERDIVLEERRSRVDNSPTGTMQEKMNAAYFSEHPYGIPVIGWEKDIRELTAKDAQAFYRRWYQPENTFLVIAGDVTLKQVKRLVKKYYEPIPSNFKAKRIHAQERPKTEKPQRLVHKSDQIQSPYFYRFYPAPHPKINDPRMSYALEVLISYLEEGGTGLLYEKLVEKHRIASHISVSYNDFSLYPSPLKIFAEPTPGHTIEELEAAIDEELEAFLKEGVSKGDVAKTKDRLLADLIYARDSAFGGARHFGWGLCVGKTLEELDNWDQYIKDVTPEEVNTVAQMVFKGAYHLTGYLLPKTVSDVGSTPMNAPKPIRKTESTEVIS